MEKTALIYDIQRFSQNDGSGIRTLVFFKGCPLNCAWCSNPESQDRGIENIYWQKLCIGCNRCTEVCPSGLNPKLVNDSACTHCGNCVQICPTQAIDRVGTWKTISEVMRIIQRDQVFYRHSNGGVTLSGGEVLQQWAFAAELAETCYAMLIDVVVETTGFAKWEQAWEVFKHCSCILYDIKFMDSKLHKQYTGIDNRLIHENAERIAQTGKPVIYRIPLLGGLNDDDENIRRTAEFAKKNGVNEIDLLPYHELGKLKYAGLGRKFSNCAYKPDMSHIRHLCRLIEKSGLKAKIEG